LALLRRLATLPVLDCFHRGCLEYTPTWARHALQHALFFRLKALSEELLPITAYNLKGLDGRCSTTELLPAFGCRPKVGL